MRILMISKALVVGTYQRKAEELARIPGVRLTVAAPPYWREGSHRVALQRAHTAGYGLAVLPMVLNGHYHVHFYRRLAALMDVVQPDVVHIDEEQYNVATFQAMRLAAARRVPALFFTWQNIDQRYPPPFVWIERYNFAHAAYAIAGNADAGAVIRAKGYTGPLAIIPQFGVDPNLFSPRHDGARGRFTVGFVCGAGRLVPPKGLDVLIRALAGLGGDWRLEVVGTGEGRAPNEALAREVGVADRVRFLGTVSSMAMPDVMRGFDVLVGPSRTTARWKEQFGRMLVEAMSCGVPVIGSDSGEIPNVIGDAGIVVPEGNVEALRVALERVRDDGGLRANLSRQGRERTLTRYTQQAVAHRTYSVYRKLAPRC